MSRTYTKAMPTTEHVRSYQHGSDASDPRFQTLIELLQQEQPIKPDEIGTRFGVSRQTVYNWLRLIRTNQPLNNRGRLRKYRGEASVAVPVRIPRTVAEAILNGLDSASQEQRKTQLRTTCERILVQELRRSLQAPRTNAQSGGQA